MAAVSQMRRLSADRDRLTEKCGQLMSDHKQAMEDRESKHANETERLRNQIRSLSAKADAAQTAQERLESELATLEDETMGWKEVREERDVLRGRVEGMAADMQRLEGLLGDAEQDRDDYMKKAQANAARIKDLELRLASEEGRHEETRDDLRAAQTAVRRLTEDVTAAGGETSSFQATIRELREAIAELTTTVAARDQTIAELKATMAANKRSAAEAIASLQQENDGLRESLAESDAQVLQHTQRIAGLEHDMAEQGARHKLALRDAEGKLAEAEAAAVALRGAHASELARLQGRIHTAEAVAQDAKRDAKKDSAAEVRALQIEKSLLEDELAAYREILDAEESRIGLPTPTRSRIEELVAGGAAADEHGDDDDDDEEAQEGNGYSAAALLAHAAPSNGAASSEPSRGKRRRDASAATGKRVARGTRSHGPARVVTSTAPGATGLSLRVDLDKELALVMNSGREVCDLSGWTLLSEAGQHYEFPEGQLVGPDQAVLVWSGEDGAGNKAAHESSLFWTSRPVWNNKGDLGRLVDADGAIACEARARPADAPLDVSAARKGARAAGSGGRGAAGQAGCAVM